MNGGNIWTPHEDILMEKHYVSKGAKWCALALMRRSPEGVRHRAVVLGLTNKPKPPKEEVKRKRTYPSPFIRSYKTPPITKELLEKVRAAIPLDTRTLTARLCGDPLPGRSALDRMKG